MLLENSSSLSSLYLLENFVLLRVFERPAILSQDESLLRLILPDGSKPPQPVRSPPPGPDLYLQDIKAEDSNLFLTNPTGIEPLKKNFNRIHIDFQRMKRAV